ncbi:MAG TPA: CpsD/CapB family tyrosine-protein kinase [Candidatus Dormibacteraeota bacterium]|nr:CpsD/CapB family tyrosine-protein kinase [Candidatus Dormibacteraeota bacterium]
MSRIHDALKKAEQERVSAPAPGTSVSPDDGFASESTAGERSPVAMATGMDDSLSAASMPLLPSEGYLRFDDLMGRCAHPRWQLDPAGNVFSNGGAASRGAEQFRTLRSRLYQLRSAQSLRTLLVTSAVPAEGKTFVSSNLAQAIVRQPDRRVLLIDADLRCPRLHLPFGAPTSPGLTDYLRGEADEAAVIQSGQDNLCLIAGGNQVSDPSELLANGRFTTLLNRVTPIFDWIILDSAPCLPVADSTLLAEYCDATLLVVRANVTPADVAQRAIQELQNRNIVGVVMNAVEEAQMYGGYYYSAGKYLADATKA